MLFNSFPFVFIFLPVALLGFYAAARLHHKLGRLWLILASFAFYIWWHPPFALVLITSVLFNYGAGQLIYQLLDKPLQRVVVTAAIGIDLLALFYYKYAFALCAWFIYHGIGQHNPATGILLPLGISFFTFTQIGFLLDCKDGGIKDRGFINYALFVTFFPHLIAGPILHHKEIMPQFADRKTYHFDYENFARGLTIFAIGMVKKVVLADSFATVANVGFASHALPFFGAWSALLCYSVQLYFDFSGYSDMAVGIARMFNIRFPINFNSPYKSTSVIEFWARWHMTLSRYLNLYLYNPLAVRATRKLAARGVAVNRKTLATPAPFLNIVVIPILFTMTLAGIWHGAGLQFLIFGVLHGCYLVVNHIWRTFGPAHGPKTSRMRSALISGGAVALTYLAVLIGQVFFRAASTSAALDMLAGMIGLHGLGAMMPMPGWMVAHLGHLGTVLQQHGLIYAASPLGDPNVAIRAGIELLIAYIIIWCMPNSQTIAGVTGPEERTKRAAVAAPPRRFALRFNLRWGIAVGVLAAVAILEIGAKSEFLYFQF